MGQPQGESSRVYFEISISTLHVIAYIYLYNALSSSRFHTSTMQRVCRLCRRPCLLYMHFQDSILRSTREFTVKELITISPKPTIRGHDKLMKLTGNNSLG